jgi:hypothetical protein
MSMLGNLMNKLAWKANALIMRSPDGKRLVIWFQQVEANAWMIDDIRITPQRNFWPIQMPDVSYGNYASVSRKESACVDVDRS